MWRVLARITLKKAGALRSMSIEAFQTKEKGRLAPALCSLSLGGLEREGDASVVGSVGRGSERRC